MKTKNNSEQETELSQEDLKKLTDFFTLLIELDQKIKRAKKKSEDQKQNHHERNISSERN